VSGFSAHSLPLRNAHATGPSNWTFFFCRPIQTGLIICVTGPSNWAYTGRGLGRDFVDRILEVERCPVLVAKQRQQYLEYFGYHPRVTPTYFHDRHGFAWMAHKAL